MVPPVSYSLSELLVAFAVSDLAVGLSAAFVGASAAHDVFFRGGGVFFEFAVVGLVGAALFFPVGEVVGFGPVDVDASDASGVFFTG
jgi:hypothetical protein